MTDESPAIPWADASVVRLAELLRELGGTPLDVAAGTAPDDRPWRRARRAVELCRLAAELAARR